MKNKKHIKESAAGGSMGGGSIAVRMDGEQSGDPLKRMEKFLKDHYKRVQNKVDFKPVKIRQLKESDNSLHNIVARLKSSEHKSYDDGVKKFAVEDEKGNLVKIVVPADQAQTVEEDIAQQLGEIEEYKSTGYKGKNISIAELVFEMRRKYNLIDVVFPEIENSGKYNSFQPTNEAPDVGSDTPPLNDIPDAGEFDKDAELGDKGLSPQNDVMDGADKDDMGGIEDEMKDADSVEDLRKNPDDDVSSLLASVLDMMKKSADAEKAKADAEAEKSRAMQAKYTAMATKSEMAQQEELISMEAEIEAQKEQEKEAKKLADLAKHKYMKSTGIEESKSFLFNILTEITDLTTTQSINMDRRAARAMTAVDKDDDEIDRELKSKLRPLKNREVENERKQLRAHEEAERKRKEKEEQEQKEEERDNQQQRAVSNQSNNLRQ